MATTSNAGEIIKSLGSALLEEIKSQVEDSMVKDFLAEIEPQIREKIRPLVSSITIQNIEQYRDIMGMKEVLAVHVKIDSP